MDIPTICNLVDERLWTDRALTEAASSLRVQRDINVQFVERKNHLAAFVTVDKTDIKEAFAGGGEILRS